MTNNLVVASNNGWRLVAFSLIAYWISLVLILKTRRDVSVVSFSSSLSSSSSVEARGRQIRLAVITPTFHREKNRNFQTIQLLALQNTLCSTGGMGMIWILVESESDWRKSSLVERYEREERPAYCERVLVKALRVKVERSKHRGVAQRNKALDWLEQQISYVEQDPVVLFVDDDNAYAAEHFVRATKIGKVGVWPVGFPSTKSKFEAPVVKAQHQSDALQSSSSSFPKVVGFRSFWCGDLKTFKPRVFNVDMSGFGIRLHALEKVRFDENVRSGYLEDAFLQAITRNVLRRDNKTSENENEGNPLHLLNALETTNVHDIFVWHLYHTTLSGETPAALVVSKVPKGDSFRCP